MSDLAQAALLGLVQGLTEFLPVSSSGHLVLFEEFLGFTGPRLFFNVLLHIATLLCIAWFFRRDLLQLARALPLLARRSDDPRRAWLLGIAVACVPTALLGLFIKRYEDFIFHSVPFVCAMLAVTGLILWLSARRDPAAEETPRAFLRKSLQVGIVQGIAVLPGISRSGSTIAAGILSGMDRAAAFRFSFLISLPAILGAELLELRGVGTVASGQWPAYGAGFVVAMLSGYFSLWLLQRVVRRGRLAWFAPYCWLLAAAGLAWHHLAR